MATFVLSSTSVSASIVSNKQAPRGKVPSTLFENPAPKKSTMPVLLMVCFQETASMLWYVVEGRYVREAYPRSSGGPEMW